MDACMAAGGLQSLSQASWLEDCGCHYYILSHTRWNTLCSPPLSGSKGRFLKKSNEETGTTSGTAATAVTKLTFYREPPSFIPNERKKLKIKRKLTRAVAIAFIGAGWGMVAGCGEDKATSPDDNGSGNGATGTVVLVGNNFFDSSNLTVTPGDKVTWQWDVSRTHTVTSGTPGNPDGTFDSDFRSSGSFSNTFDAVGTFSYYCQVHGASMSGTIKVSSTGGDDNPGGNDDDNGGGGYGDPYGGGG